MGEQPTICDICGKPETIPEVRLIATGFEQTFVYCGTPEHRGRPASPPRPRSDPRG